MVLLLSSLILTGADIVVYLHAFWAASMRAILCYASESANTCAIAGHMEGSRRELDEHALLTDGRYIGSVCSVLRKIWAGALWQKSLLASQLSRRPLDDPYSTHGPFNHLWVGFGKISLLRTLTERDRNGIFVSFANRTLSHTNACQLCGIPHPRGIHTGLLPRADLATKDCKLGEPSLLWQKRASAAFPRCLFSFPLAWQTLASTVYGLYTLVHADIVAGVCWEGRSCAAGFQKTNDGQAESDGPQNPAHVSVAQSQTA